MVSFPWTHTPLPSQWNTMPVNPSYGWSQPCDPGLVSWGCPNKMPQNPCLKTTDCFLLNSGRSEAHCAEIKACIAKLWSFLEPQKGGDPYITAPCFLEPTHDFLVLFLGFFVLFCFICLFCPITAIFSVLRSCLTFLPSSAWPKISCDLRSLTSNLIPPAALTPFGHVARFQAQG